MRDAFAAELLAQARCDERVMFVTADLGFGVFEEYIDSVPAQYLNVGVAEQNMIAVATGLALEGHRVFAYSIGNFPVLRCLEQIRNDAAYHGANLTVVSVGAGFSYGPLGMSHHATEDIAVIRALPEVTTLVPGTSDEVVGCLRALPARTGTSYLRLDKSTGVEPTPRVAFTFGRWRVMSQGDDIALVAAGGILEEAQKAAEILACDGIGARVVSAHLVSQVDPDVVLEAIGPVTDVITLEEHVVRGGLGGLVAETLAESGRPIRLRRLGLSGPFVSTVGSQRYLRACVGIDAESVVDAARALLRERQPVIVL